MISMRSNLERIWLCIITISFIFLFQFPGIAFTADDQRERTLVIGKVSSNPKKHYNSLKPIADYVVSHMHDLGIDQVKVLMASNNKQMAEYFRQGRVDWVAETVFSALEFEKEAGAEILLVRHKKGVVAYNTVFFTRNDSGVKRLQDLTGKVIAFEDRGSTTGFFIPAAILLNAGIKLVKLSSPRESVPDDAVGYVFAGAEINISTWVYKHLVDAGAYSNLDWNKEDHLLPAFKQDLNIFYTSGRFPRSIEIVRKDLRPEIKKRLKDTLMAALNDPKAKAALRSFQKTTGFCELNDHINSRIDHARIIMTQVKDGLQL